MGEVSRKKVSNMDVLCSVVFFQNLSFKLTWLNLLFKKG